MKKALPYLMLLIAALLYWKMDRPTRVAVPPAPELPSAPAEAEKPPPAPPAKPEPVAVAPPAQPPPPKRAPPDPAPAKQNPRKETFDPRSKRNLDLPLPKSVRDLQENRTPYAVARLPLGATGSATTADSDTQGYFAGYAYLADGSTRRLRLQTAWGDTKFAIEDHEGDIKQWSRSGRTIRVENFNRDPYALVLQFPDQRILYVKFKNDVAVKDYPDPMRAQVGWLISDSSDNPSVAPVALIDVHAHNRQFPPGSPGAEEWPQRGSLRALTTALPALPADEEPAP